MCSAHFFASIGSPNTSSMPRPCYAVAHAGELARQVRGVGGQDRRRVRSDDAEDVLVAHRDLQRRIAAHRHAHHGALRAVLARVRPVRREPGDDVLRQRRLDVAVGLAVDLHRLPRDGRHDDDQVGIPRPSCAAHRASRRRRRCGSAGSRRSDRATRAPRGTCVRPAWSRTSLRCRRPPSRSSLRLPAASPASARRPCTPACRRASPSSRSSCASR